MSSYWWNCHQWLHWKLSFWQLPVQPVMTISSIWWPFHQYNDNFINMTAFPYQCFPDYNLMQQGMSKVLHIMRCTYIHIKSTYFMLNMQIYISVSCKWHYFDSLLQDCSNSIGDALELLESCTMPMILHLTMFAAHPQKFCCSHTNLHPHNTCTGIHLLSLPPALAQWNVIITACSFQCIEAKLALPWNSNRLSGLDDFNEISRRV